MPCDSASSMAPPTDYLVRADDDADAAPLPTPPTMLRRRSAIVPLLRRPRRVVLLRPVRRPPRPARPRRPLHHPGAVGQRRGGPVPDRGRHAAPRGAAHPNQKGSTMNDITRKRAQRVKRRVADGSIIRLGDGQIIECDRLAQQTARQAVIMTSTTGHGAHLIAIWCDRCASRHCISGAAHSQSPSASVSVAGANHSARPHRPPWLLPPCGFVRLTAEANVPTPIILRRGGGRLCRRTAGVPPRPRCRASPLLRTRNAPLHGRNGQRRRGRTGWRRAGRTPRQRLAAPRRLARRLAQARSPRIAGLAHLRGQGFPQPTVASVITVSHTYQVTLPPE